MMQDKQSEQPDFGRFKPGQRKVVKLSQEQLVMIGSLGGERKFPVLIEPAACEVNLSSWAMNHRPVIEELLAEHGAILFRNFNVTTAGAFEDVIQSISENPLEYNERSSPRSQVDGRIYTSTDYPPEQSIFLHNEQSYNCTFPRKIFFFCLTAPQSGGETPIADCRRVYERLDPEIVQTFRRKKYMYVRNFGDGFGLSWRDAFQTKEKAVVEDYCRRNDIQVEWKEHDRLRTRQVRHVVAHHPLTGRNLWFNHMTFFHISTLEPQLRKSLQSEFSDDELPNNTFYGDGSEIEPDVMDHLRQAYTAEAFAFPWQKKDILLLDNMATAHGRSPYAGPRKIVVGMTQLMDWKEASAE